MRKLREILRLKWAAHRSHREVAQSLGVSAGTVASVVGRARLTGLTWAQVEERSDDALERQLYGPPAVEGDDHDRPRPDLAWMHRELRRPGVPLELLHVEYLAAQPTGYRYSAFCGRYRAWRAQQRPSMRQVHRAGEKAFVDYAGRDADATEHRLDRQPYARRRGVGRRARGVGARSAADGRDGTVPV